MTTLVLPANKGYIIGEKKIYGNLPANSQQVELLDVATGKVHVWNRRAHTVLVPDDKLLKLCYETSNQMVPCDEEAKTGKCSHRFEPEHRKFHYHFCRRHPRFVKGKPVCRYSLNDRKGLVCWLGQNAEHIKCYHHES